MVVVLSCHWRINEMLNACGVGSVGNAEVCVAHESAGWTQIMSLSLQCCAVGRMSGVEVGMESGGRQKGSPRYGVHVRRYESDLGNGQKMQGQIERHGP